MTTTEEYSPAEVMMIVHFGFGNLIHHCQALPLYRMMVEQAFMTNDQTWAADALRRCMEAFNNQGKMKIYRLTPEWEALIFPCPNCGGKGWNYPGQWSIGLLQPYNAILQIPCEPCKGSGVGQLDSFE